MNTETIAVVPSAEVVAGLTSAKAQALLREHGPNALPLKVGTSIPLLTKNNTRVKRLPLNLMLGRVGHSGKSGFPALAVSKKIRSISRLVPWWKSKINESEARPLLS